MADASTESIKLSSRARGLPMVARRAVWLKTWSGDSASKFRLCILPFSGDLLFGPGLDKVLERTADRKISFSTKKTKCPERVFSWTKGAILIGEEGSAQKNTGQVIRETQTATFSLALLANPPNSNDYRMPVGGRLATSLPQ